MYEPGHTPSHAGRSTTSLPFKQHEIPLLKAALADDLRSLALLTFALNVGMRCQDILDLRRDALRCHDDGRLWFEFKEGKTGHHRRVDLNAPTSEVLMRWLNTSDGTYVFETQRGQMTSSYFNRQLKEWAVLAGLSAERRSTHSLRKTFVRTNWERGVKIEELQRLCGHATSLQTMTYCGITEEDTARIYANVI